jgi:hypothetical protein
MDENIKVTGHIHIVLTGPDNVVKEVRDIKNTVTTIGKSYLASWLAAPSQSGSFMPYVALGSGTNPPSVADTTLQTELTVIGYSRSLATLSAAGTNLLSQAVFNPGDGTAIITEAGIISASTGGVLFAHQVFNAISKTSVDTLSITWTINFS